MFLIEKKRPRRVLALDVADAGEEGAVNTVAGSIGAGAMALQNAEGAAQAMAARWDLARQSSTRRGWKTNRTAVSSAGLGEDGGVEA